MYIRNDKLYIGIEEIYSRGFQPSKLLGKEIDNMSKQMVNQFNKENGETYKFVSVFGLISEELVINVS